jgi:hypothetical protein
MPSVDTRFSFSLHPTSLINTSIFSNIDSPDMADTRLPSIAEILEATEVLSSPSGFKVAKAKGAFVVKYAGSIPFSEAETMRYD